MNKKLFFESSLITILSFIILWLFYLLINISFAPFNYVVNSVSSIDLNDLYFSTLDKNNIDTNILIINIGDAERNEINDVLKKLQEKFNKSFIHKIDFFDGEWKIVATALEAVDAL